MRELVLFDADRTSRCLFVTCVENTYLSFWGGRGVKGRGRVRKELPGIRLYYSEGEEQRNGGRGEGRDSSKMLYNISCEIIWYSQGILLRFGSFPALGTPLMFPSGILQGILDCFFRCR